MKAKTLAKATLALFNIVCAITSAGLAGYSSVQGRYGLAALLVFSVFTNIAAAALVAHDVIRGGR